MQKRKQQREYLTEVLLIAAVVVISMTNFHGLDHPDCLGGLRRGYAGCILPDLRRVLDLALFGRQG